MDGPQSLPPMTGVDVPRPMTGVDEPQPMTGVDEPQQQHLPPMTGVENKTYHCFPCKAVCNSREMLGMHMGSRKHATRIAALGGPGAFQPLDEESFNSAPPTAMASDPSETNGSRKRKNAQGRFRCDPCQMDFDSPIPYEAHMQGKKHTNKVQRLESGPVGHITCDVCDISVTSQEIYHLHVNGKKHLAKVAKLEDAAANPEKPKIMCTECGIELMNEAQLTSHLNGKKHKKPKSSVEKETYTCEFCDVTVNCLTIFEQHRNGKKHAEKVRKIAEGESGKTPSQFVCETCQVTVSCQDLLDSHLNGKKHLKMLENAKAEGKPPTPFVCEPCQVTVTCQDLLDAHLNGRKHHKMLETIGAQTPITDANRQWSCELCGFAGNSEAHLQAHVNGKPHARRAGLTLSSPSPKKAVPDPAAPPPYCDVCHLLLNSPKMLESHLAGKAHAKRVSQANQENAVMMADSLIQSVREETETVRTKSESEIKMDPESSEPSVKTEASVPVPATNVPVSPVLATNLPVSPVPAKVEPRPLVSSPQPQNKLPIPAQADALKVPLNEKKSVPSLVEEAVALPNTPTRRGARSRNGRF